MPAKLWHAQALYATMRGQDRDEVTALGLDPLMVLLQSVSRDTKTAFVGDKIVAMFGIATSDDRAAIWMLGSDELLNHRTAFLRFSKRFVAEGLRQHKTLVNYVDCRNTAAIKWLKWLGAKFDLPTPYGLHGKPFLPFYFGENPYVR